MEDHNPNIVDLRDYLGVLRRHRWTVVATTAIVVVVALIGTLIQPRTYEAAVKIAVQPPSEGSDLERILFGATDLGTQREILTSTALIRGVLAEHDLPRGESDVDDFLNDDVTVDEVDGTTVLLVTVRAREPRMAASLAQSMAESYLAYLQRDAADRTVEAKADLATAERTTRSELRSIEEQLSEGAGTTRQSLEEERDQLYARLRWIATRRAELENATAFMRRGDIIQPAFVPDEPAAPDPLRTGVLALVVGGMLGIGLAFLRDHLDDVVRDGTAVRACAAGPVLAVVQSVQHDAEGHAASATGQAADGYHRLRSQLIARSRSDGRSGLRIVVTPAGKAGDAAVVATNLSLCLARSGRRVALIDGDLRRATASGMFGMEGPGLADVLAGRASLIDVVGRPDPNVQVVPAGAADAARSDDFASAPFKRLLDMLARDVDDLIVIAPSVAAQADALDVAAQGCGIVLVARPFVTTRTEVCEAVDQFAQLGARVVGTVLANTSDATTRPPAVDTTSLDHEAVDEGLVIGNETITTR